MSNNSTTAIAIQDTTTREKKQNGKGWSEDGTSYTLDAAATQGVAIPIQEIGKRTGVSTTDRRAGIGIGRNGDAMFTMQAGAQHGVAFHENQRAEVSLNHTTGSVKCAGGKPGQGYPAVMVGAPTGAVAYSTKLHNTTSNNAGKVFEEYSTCLDSNSPPPALLTPMAVRRLTPKECERLQGFPDDHTLIEWRGKSADLCPDGPRYKALGNSMAVPCMAWIGKRIAAQESGPLRYLSVCSGIEAASVAWEPLGWKPAGFSEIEKFPSAVLAHHWPDVPNLGDMTQYEGWNYAYEKSDKTPAVALESGDSLPHDGRSIQRDAGETEQSLRSLRVCDGEASSGSRPSNGASARHPMPSLQREAADSRGQRLGDAGVGLLERARIDFTSIDLLVGGTPCQAFSVAGLRRSLEDERGNLSLTYIHLLDEIDEARIAAGRPPTVCVWENVPGVLSTKDNAFGCFLGALAGSGCALQPPGGRWGNAGYVRGPKRQVCWRVLDAQYFGVAQRRRRVFVVANAGDRISPAKVLFELESVCRNPAPSRETGERTAANAGAGVEAGSWPAEVAATLRRENGSPGYANQDLFAQSGANLVPATVGALTDGAHNGGGLTDKMLTRDAYLPSVANPLTARMGKGINTTLDEGQTPIIEP